MSKSDLNALNSALIALLKTQERDEFDEAVVTQAKYLVDADEGYISLQGSKIEMRNASSVLEIPLAVGKKKFGTLTLIATKRNPFTQADQRLLAMYAEAVSLLLEKFQVYEKTKELLTKREAHISYTSHELRNPLTSINGYIEMLYTKREKDTSAQTRWIEELYEENVRFTELLKELLDIEKIRKKD